MYSQIIHIDGPDKTGKDTIRDILVKEAKGNYLVIVRSYISQIVYARLYNRKINETFFKSRMKHEYECGSHFFVLSCTAEVAAERFKKHDEKDMNIADFNKHIKTFYEVCEELSEDVHINFLDTSNFTPEEIAFELEYIITNKVQTHCNACSLGNLKINEQRLNRRAETSKPEYLIVGINPSKIRESDTIFDDCDKNECFINALKNAGILEKSIFTNLVKCSTPDNKIIQEQFNACKFHLKHEIEMLKPKIIVALGDHVYNFLISSKLFPTHNIVKIYHPAYQYAYNKISKENYVKHIFEKLYK